MTALARKSAATAYVTAPGEYDEAPNGSFSVILSTPTKDRDGEEVKADEWLLPLPKWITFDVDHGLSVEKTIGSGLPFLAPDGSLRVFGTFSSSPLAQQTRALIVEGHIRSTSVTFLRKSIVLNGKTVTRRELLNGSFVAIPSNVEALVLSAKTHGSGPSPAQVRNAIADARRLVADSQDPTTKALAGAQRTIVRGIAADARRL
jgi:hypothetical protein